MSTYGDPIEITERELRQHTTDLDEMHHATLPGLRENVAEWTELHREAGGGISGPASAGTTRRRFLLGAGAAFGSVVLAACGGDGKDDEDKSATPGGKTPKEEESAAAGLTGDLQIACMAASLENLAVSTYGAGITSAQAGRLGTVPPAIVTFAQTAMKQHADHADAWNAILTGGGKTKVTDPDNVVKPQVDQQLLQVKDVAGLAKLALSLENVAAATYLNGIGVIQNKQALKTAASIQPVEMQHAAILNFVLGQYPVPDTFARTDGARPPTDCTRS